jgi:hypothetical protein
MYKNPKTSKFEMARIFLFLHTFIALFALGGGQAFVQKPTRRRYAELEFEWTGWISTNF